MNEKVFEIAGGSIPGRDHLGRNEVLLGRNNQDAFLWGKTDSCLVAVVCDGCGSLPNSEVGAKIAAKLIVKTLTEHYQRFLQSEGSENGFVPPEAFWEAVRWDLLARIRTIAEQMRDPNKSLAEVIRDFFLFTVVGVLSGETGTAVFAIGDGIFAVNGEVQTLGPFPENKPPYLSYGLVETCFSNKPELLKFRIAKVLPTNAVESIMIGSDGVGDIVNLEEENVPGLTKKIGPLSQFWQNDCYFKNPDAIRRRLSLLNREVKRINPETDSLQTEGGLLRDDTTLVVIRSEQSERGQLP